jgi:hypothetical protein
VSLASKEKVSSETFFRWSAAPASCSFMMPIASTPRKSVGKPSRYPPLAAAACALFAWLTPTHELPWTSFHAELAAALAALIIGAWAFWHSSRKQARQVPALAALVVLATLIPMGQSASGIIVFRGDAALVGLYLLGFGLAVLVGQLAAAGWGHERVLQGMAWLVLSGAIASAWLALYQWQQLDYLGLYASNVEVGGRPFANFNQPNHLATLLVLGLLSAALLYDAAKVGPAVSMALSLLLSFALAMTQSRGGLLAMAVGSVVLIGKPRLLGRRLALRHVLISALVVLAMPLAWEVANSLVGQVSGREAADAAAASTRRIVHWSSMFDAALRHQWVGYGWNQSVLAQFAVAPDHPPSFEVFAYAHNILVDLIIWNGLPLGLVFIAALGLWFRAAWRGTSDSTTVLALASVGAMFVLALLEYPLYYTYFLLPTGFLMGAISAAAMPRAVLQVPAWLAPALLVVAGITLAVVTSDYLGLEADVRSLRFERARIGMDRPRHELSQPLLLTHVAAFAQFARTPERSDMSKAELGTMNDVAQRFPSAENIVRYAAALALNKRQDQAADVLRRVCKTHSVTACADSEKLWRALGKREPNIASTPWPVE